MSRALRDMAWMCGALMLKPSSEILDRQERCVTNASGEIVLQHRLPHRRIQVRLSLVILRDEDASGAREHGLVHGVAAGGRERGRSIKMRIDATSATTSLYITS